MKFQEHFLSYNFPACYPILTFLKLYLLLIKSLILFNFIIFLGTMYMLCMFVFVSSHFSFFSRKELNSEFNCGSSDTYSIIKYQQINIFKSIYILAKKRVSCRERVENILEFLFYSRL